MYLETKFVKELSHTKENKKPNGPEFAYLRNKSRMFISAYLFQLCQ